MMSALGLQQDKQYAQYAPQQSIVKDDTVTSMQNQLADEIITLRDNIGALSKALSPVCLPPPGSDEVMNSAQPQHSLLSLAQLQTLIYQVRHAAQDVRDMLGGLRV